MTMKTVVVRESYTEILEHLGDFEQVADDALREYAVHQAEQQILELQERVSTWEGKYGCSFDLFAYRTSTDQAYVQELEANPDTSQWEADLFSWEFYAMELKEWRQRLNSISTT